ncbi:SDR family oxidoreductase [Neolewinella aurantiaca]|uniref:SDR family oxidoreductase n=1 Tax=Neolewinella aurantiaca TaxID=2602767 RepID=A0A5C7FV28_9BACT|nr:SDR family oxidoreductase [Neolewinella aurantiaca]TXF88707.1 SDR family oxidoreductase [Neolewinella aurantiaca]
MNILITGVSSGIGATTAELLLKSGHHVYGTVRKAGDAGQLTRHPAFSALVMDVTDRPAIVEAMATIKATGQPLHAVINNAGIAVSGPLETIAEEDYRKQFDVNVFGNLAVSQEALPLLHAAREAGETNVKIINVGSVSGYVTAPFTSLYSASKFAVEALTDGMRRELIPFGIDVLSVAPGPVKTPIWKKGKTQTKAFEGNRYSHILSKLAAYTEGAEAGGVEPELVAGIIRDMLESDRPRPDRLVMKRNWVIRLLMLAPKRWQDKLFLKNMESNKRY